MKKVGLPQLQLATSRDMLRPAMQYIKFDGYIATATDGHILVRVDLKPLFEENKNFKNPENIKGKAIYWKVWNEMRNSEHIEFTKDSVILLRDGYFVEIELNPPGEDYPNFLSILSEFTPENKKEIGDIGFNLALFDRIKKALDFSYSGHFQVHFFGKNRGTLLTLPAPDYHCFGLIMPVIIDNKNQLESVQDLLKEENPNEL